jgi:hypothetical protein
MMRSQSCGNPGEEASRLNGKHKGGQCDRSSPRGKREKGIKTGKR